MRLFHLLLGLVLGLTLVAPATAEYGRLVPGQSRLEFVSRQMGVPVSGQFRKFDLRMAFDPARPATARAVLEIDMTGVDAGYPEANEEVVTANWLDVRRFPHARFESTAIRPLGGHRYELRGRATIKGRTAEMVLPVTFTPAGRSAVLEGAFTLKRLAWGIGQGPWGDPSTVADEVEVKFRFVVEQAATAPPARR